MTSSSHMAFLLGNVTGVRFATSRPDDKRWRSWLTSSRVEDEID